MMQPVHRAASAIVRHLARQRSSPSQRRRARPHLEVLETRRVLNSDTWTGLDSKSPTLWNDPGNWLGDQVPSAGSAVLFQALNSQTDGSGHAYPTGTTVDLDSADVSSITVQDNYLLEGNPSSAHFPAGQLTFDNNATITTGTGDKLTFAGDLALNGFGGTTESGAGTVEIDEQGVPALNLTQLTVSSGTLFVPQTTEFASTRITVGANATLEVGAGTHSTIGSLNGFGTVVMDGQQATLAIDTPENVFDVFGGSFAGAGGTIQMEGAGSLTIGNINYDQKNNREGPGTYQLDVGSGTILVTGKVYLDDLVPLLGGTDTSALEVEPQATFGGPGTVTVGGQAIFDDGSTYSVDIDGPPSTGSFTSITESPDGQANSQLAPGVQIGAHTTLSISAGPGYMPDQQDGFSIISTGPSSFTATVTGSFTSVTMSAVVPFAVDYNSDFFHNGVVNVGLEPDASVTKTTVTLDPSSKSLSGYGQSVTFDATVAVSGDGTDVPIGVVTFYDGNPAAGGTQIGEYSPEFAGGSVSIATSSLSVTGSPHSIYAVYMYQFNSSEPNLTFVNSTSAPPVLVTITPVTLTVAGVTANDKVYDGTTADTLDTSHAKLTGVLPGDSVMVAPTGYSASFGNKNVGGNKAVTVAGLSLAAAQAGNYTLTQPTGLAADITRATLTATGVTANKVYDGTTTATLNTTSAGFSGLARGDDVKLVTGGATASFNNRNVGDNKPVTASGLSIAGADSGNYTLAQPLILLASITPHPLAVAGVTVGSKSYDGTTTDNLDTGQARLTGIIGGDDVRLVTAGATASFANKHAGNSKPVTVSGLSLTGANAGNYAIGPLVLTASIAQVPLTVTADDQSMAHGGSVPSLTYAVSGLVGGDTESSACTGALATTGSSSSPAGTYAITQGTLSSVDYAIHFNGAILTIADPPVIVHGASIGSATVLGVLTGKKARNKHKTVPAILVAIGGPVNAAAAQNLGNYRLATVPRGKKKSKAVALSGATWSATTMTVTLVTRKPLVKGAPLRLTIIASGLGLSGGDYVANLG